MPASPPPGPHPWRSTLLALVVVAALLASVAGTSAATAQPPAAGTPDHENPPSATVVTPNESDSEHRGDVVPLALSTGGAGDATVRNGAATGAYRAKLSVADRDGDGRVRLRWNTYLAGHGGAYDAVGNDTVAVESEFALDGRVQPGPFEATATTDGERVDTATVNLTAPGAPSLRSLVTVPGRNVTLSTLADVRAAERAGDLRASKRAWLRGVLVLELRAPGIEGALAAQPGGNASARFANLTATDGFGFSFVQDWRTVGTMEEPMRLRLPGRGARVLADPANDSYYLLLDVDRARFENQDHQLHAHDAGDWFDANFTVGPASGLVEQRRTATVEKVVVSEPGVELDEPVEPLVRPRANQRLVADTNLPTGMRVTVVARVLFSDFERRLTVPVTSGPAGNHVNATLDLSSLGTVTKLRVRYFLDGREVGTGFRDPVQTAVVTADEYEVSIAGVERTGDPSAPVAVTVNATLGEAGYVVLHAGSARGRVLGVSRWLEPGSYTGLTVEASAPLRDAERAVVVVHDHNIDGYEYAGDPAVVLNGTRVTAAVDIPPERTPTASPSPTPSPPPTPGPTAGSPTPTEPPTVTTTPGFGPLAALVAVVVVALVRPGR